VLIYDYLVISETRTNSKPKKIQTNRYWAIYFSPSSLHGLRLNFISSSPQCNLILQNHVDCHIIVVINEKNCSSDIGSFDSFWSQFFAKVIPCFKTIFTKWIWFANYFKCFPDGNAWPPGQRAEIRERIASESLQKIRAKFYEVAGHVGRVQTVVMYHLRKMFRRQQSAVLQLG